MKKTLLAASILLSLAGCGNESSDQPAAPVPQPEHGNKPVIGEEYTHKKVVDIAELYGETGEGLITAIEGQLNQGLTARSGLFKITPKWGMGTAGDWDLLNLNVVQDENGEYVLETEFAAETVGMPGQGKAFQNGFSFTVELPNGLVKEAVMAYNYKLKTGLGYGADGSKSPDYIFLGGFTSGDPLVANAATTDGTGFTYKLNTDRYAYLSTRFADAKDNSLFNKVLTQDGQKFRIQSSQWNLVQLDLTANSFDLEGNAIADGNLTMAYNNKEMVPDSASSADRILIDEQHNYQLTALMEFYRHYKHGSDQLADLHEQVLQLKDITFAWSDEVVVLPEQPPVEPDPEPTPDNYCSDQGFSHSRIVDLTGLKGADHQKIMDAISNQLGEVKNGAAQFNVDRNNIEVVDVDGELALKVTYAAGAVGKDNAGNGSSLTVDFPTAEAFTAACMGFDVQYALDVASSANNDLVILPSLHLKDTTSDAVVAEHNYVINHNKRLGNKFGASFLTWYDGSTKYWAPARWNTTVQTLEFDPDTGVGRLESLLNNEPHFKPIDGVEYNEKQYQIVPQASIGNLGVVASFDSYRPDASKPGKAEQTFLFKNIAIGWK